MIDLTRRRFLTATSAIGAALLASDVGAQPPATGWVPTPERLARIEELVAGSSLPGMGIAVIEEGSPAWTGSFGVTNVETREPVTGRTLFQAASMTKPVCSWLALRLIEDGRLALDSRLVDYVRPADFPDDPRLDEITVAHVLTHSTGLPNWRDQSEDGDTSSLRPSQQPGSGWTYSGEAFVWLQRVLETIEGRSFARIAGDRLFGPAGMSDSFLCWLPETDGREVYGHQVEAGRPVLADIQYFRQLGPSLQVVAERWGRPIDHWTLDDFHKALDVKPPLPAGPLADMPLWRQHLPGNSMVNAAASLRCTPADYARFLSLFFPHRAEDWELSAEMRQRMITPQMERPNVHQPWGYGIGIERRDDANLIYHEGSNSGQYISMAIAQPERRRAVALFTHGADAYETNYAVLQVITQQAFRVIS